MKIQLDTDNKNIKLEEKVNLGDLEDILEKILPSGKWREFTLEVNTVINWDYPYKPLIIEPYNPYPWTYPWITYTAEKGSEYNLNSGIYNVQI